ncbi:MAG: hypothetical protein FJ191_05025 [Gammaproteobacteria bacterium]|nr:hypothetical protein [Gammaproteobacteria bacterium]
MSIRIDSFDRRDLDVADLVGISSTTSSSSQTSPPALAVPADQLGKSRGRADAFGCGTDRDRAHEAAVVI